MTRIRLLVPSAGRKVALVRELERYFQVYVGGLETEMPACRLHANTRHVSLPEVSDPGYATAVLAAVRELGIDAVLPVRNGDMHALELLRTDLFMNGVVLVLSRHDTVEVCNDKLLLQGFVSQVLGRYSNTLKHTPTIELHRCNFEHMEPPFVFPLFAKLRYGAGSRRCEVLRCDDDVGKLEKGPEWVIQPLLTGQEYTADMFFGLDGKWKQTVLRKRLSVADGQMDHGEIVHDCFTGQVDFDEPGGWNTHGFVGPINVQFFQCPDSISRITDINPRIGGGAILTIRSGVDFVRHLYEVLSGQEVTVTKPVIGMQARSFIDYVLGLGG